MTVVVTVALDRDNDVFSLVLQTVFHLCRINLILLPDKTVQKTCMYDWLEDCLWNGYNVLSEMLIHDYLLLQLL